MAKESEDSVQARRKTGCEGRGRRDGYPRASSRAGPGAAAEHVSGQRLRTFVADTPGTFRRRESHAERFGHGRSNLALAGTSSGWARRSGVCSPE